MKFFKVVMILIPSESVVLVRMHVKFGSEYDVSQRQGARGGSYNRDYQSDWKTERPRETSGRRHQRDLFRWDESMGTRQSSMYKVWEKSIVCWGEWQIR